MKYDAANCPCKRLKCERHGDCKACIEHHHTSKRKLYTYCEKVENKMERKREKELKKKK